MAIEISDLSSLPESNVTQIRETLAQWLQEEHDTLDLRRGVLHDLLLHYSAVLAAATQENIDRVRQSSSLLAIQENPDLADDDIVDKVLSNYRLTRRAGTAASGQITIVVSQLAPVSIASGAVFVADGKSFRSDASYMARTSAATAQSDTDKVLQPIGDGNYAFTISVTAGDVGVAGQITKDTLFEPSAAIVNYVKSYAASDFTGGVDTETSAAALARLQAGIACQALSNRVNMASLLTSQSAFSDVLHSSVIGYGDAEMLRDQHSIFPVSYGGRADWYVRTQAVPQQLGLTKTATLVQKLPNNFGIWQLALGRDEAPGFYDVVNIRPGDAPEVTGSFEITLETRANDVTAIAGQLIPDIETVAEGAYSRYQTAVIQFYDTETDCSALTVGDTQDYAVTVRAMPLVADIQAFVGSRAHRNYAGDVLVRAPVPCFVSLAFTLEGRVGEPLPDAYAIKDQLAGYVNNLGFCGRLYASDLADIIYDNVEGKISVANIDMFGQIRRPDGSVKPLRSAEVLVIPSEPDRMVTARTTTFILAPADIAISARTVNMPEAF